MQNRSIIISLITLIMAIGSIGIAAAHAVCVPGVVVGHSTTTLILSVLVGLTAGFLGGMYYEKKKGN